MPVVNLWNPHKTQQILVADKSRFKVIRCGRRWGKTTYAVSTAVKSALLKPNSLIYYIGPTYEQAKSIAWNMLLQTVKALPKALVRKTNEAELYVVLGNNSKIEIKGADKPDRLRGIGLDGAILDEYATMKPQVWSQIIRPALVDRKGWAQFLGTPKGFNHFYDLYIKAENHRPGYDQGGDSNWTTYHFTSYDNPLIDPKEIDNARAEDAESFDQEYMAEFRKAEGAVYKDFNHDIHIIDKLPERHFSDCIAGVDFGFTNPAAVVVLKHDKDDNYYVVEEFYETGKTTPEIIEQCKLMKYRWGINSFYPDSAEPDRIAEMRRAGLYCRETSKEVNPGIDRVRNLLRMNKLFILSTCENLIFEMDAYVYKNTKSFGTTEQVVKDNDHALDALRYALYSNSRVVDDEEEIPFREANFDPY